MNADHPTPTRTQVFWAENRPAQVWFVLVITGVVIYSVWKWAPAPSELRSWTTILAFMGVLVCGFLLGSFVALLVGWFVLGPMYYDRELRNGGPFQVGDSVMILSKPHRGRVSRVYEQWQHGTVRVELGEEQSAAYSDVFASTNLVLVSRPSRTQADSAEPDASLDHTGM